MDVYQTIKDVLYHSLELLIAFDQSGKIILLNEKSVKELGYKDKEADIKDVLPRLFSDGRQYEDVIEGLEQNEQNTIVYRKNQTCFPAVVKVITSVCIDHKNAILMGIWNRHKEEQALKQTEKLRNEAHQSVLKRNQFVANIAHELRTPVNGIQGHAKNLLEDEKDPEKKEIFQIILKCCQNMGRIVNSFLDYAKIEEGKFELCPAPFSLRSCISHIVNTSLPIANEKGLDFNAYIGHDIPDMLIGDELRIVQILNNLVSNALKFTSIGSVRIAVYQSKRDDDKTDLIFFVRDTGIGVTLEEKEKMFHSFSQVDASITREYGGTGLGLYVTRQLIELMNGTIDLESEKGRGSTFTFTIPLAIADMSTVAQDDQNLISEKNASKACVKEMEKTLSQSDRGVKEQEKFAESVYCYHSSENATYLRATIEKLTLCMEMRKWDKAENFAENLKKLCEGAPSQIRKEVFHLLMSVRKEDYDSGMKQLGTITDAVKL